MISIEKIKLLIVDDSLFMRKLICEILEGMKEVEIVGEAKNGVEAAKLAFLLEPDIVTMDFNMPLMDGELAIKKILQSNNNPPAIILLSANTEDGLETTMRCLRAGAIDFIHKPSGKLSMNLDTIKKELIEKIKTAVRARIQIKIGKLISRSKNIYKNSEFIRGGEIKAVVIGASTGGPTLVEDILVGLPANLNIPIFIVQHMPLEFTASFAERLNKYSAVRVKEASDGDEVMAGICYLAKGGWHMKIKDINGRPIIHLTQEDKQGGYRPSINVTMQSVADYYKKKTLGIILTGMGDDGTIGMGEIKAAGGYTLVQIPETAVISSMPLSVIQAGFADEQLVIKDIIKRIIKLTHLDSFFDI